MEKIIYTLKENKNINDEMLKELLENDSCDELLYKEADSIRRSIYSDEIYIRGLIEISNYCKNNCYYCGIRCDNKKLTRYRLTKEEIFSCAHEGYNSGFRTFVLQGGEDPFFTDDIICEIVSGIKSKFADCAVTLSLGEKSKESYESYFKAGANRYLLRHETATPSHYEKLHPHNMSLENRKKCLFNLKGIGYQVGSGFMVDSPYQTVENIISDIRFLQELKPDMIGIGPYLTHKDTPFCSFKSGSLKKTLKLISILRLMFPYALIPSTTALGTIHKKGREMGLLAGANVIMPNLSPLSVRKLYEIYDNKLSSGLESAQGISELKKITENIGYRIVTDIGDVKKQV